MWHWICLYLGDIPLFKPGANIMNRLRHPILAVVLCVLTGTAHAVVIDFKSMAEPGGSHGESAWDPLTLSFTGFNLSITAAKDGNDAYAYLDSGNAGLGVCGGLLDSNDANSITNSGTNLCDPSNDDNVTFRESLFLVFSDDVVIENLWFNNNHDGDRSLLGDMIDLGGSAHTFDNGGAGLDSVAGGPFQVAGDSVFSIAFNNEQFYLSAIEVTTPVPGPAPLALFVMGLAGLGLARQGKRG